MSDEATLTKEKHQLVNKCLDDDHVLVHLDSRKEGVDLPPDLMNRPMVTLKLSKFFRGGVTLEADKIITDLLFDRGYMVCAIPLEAVWGVTNVGGQNFIWPQSTPAEVIGNQLKLGPQKALGPGKEAAPEKNKGKKSTPLKKPAREKRPAAGHLKRVK